MSEEISKQYEKGLVDLMSIVEPLIDKFKADKNSIDIQQLQLVAEYLLTERKIDENYIDELEVELDKEKEKNKKIENKIKMETNRLKKHGYWEFLEQRDLDKTISIIQNFLEE